MFDQYFPQTGWHSVEGTQIPQSGPLGGILDGLRGLLGGGRDHTQPESPLFPGVPILEKLDNGDILLLILLYYLYRETQDEEWLIILGLMLLGV